MSKPTVFICYSHNDEQEKDYLLTHLKSLEREGIISTWSDDLLTPGEDIEQGIDEAIEKADVAILLITANFLASEYLVNKQLPKLKLLQEEGELIVYSIIVKACAWKNINWLQKMKIRPKNKRPIWSDGGLHADEDLAAIADEIASILKQEKEKIDSEAFSLSDYHEPTGSLFSLRNFKLLDPMIYPFEKKVFPHIKAYLQYLAYQNRFFDVKGLSTQNIYTLELEEVFVDLQIYHNQFTR